MAKTIRPSLLQENSPLSDYYTIEGLIRYAESRMFYIVNDHRPDRNSKYCWDCGNNENPLDAQQCIGCGAPIRPRKFLVSVRWETREKKYFEDFFSMESTEHPALLSPFDLFTERSSMYVVYDWDNYEFLLDQSAPWKAQSVLELAQRLLGLMAHFHQMGISLENLGVHNLLLDTKNNQVLMFDPVVSKLYPSRVPEADRSKETALVAGVLKRFTSLTDTKLCELLENAESGHFSTPYDMGRAIEQLFVENYNPPFNPYAAALSDVGLFRPLNEDNWGWLQLRDNLKLYIVADGMGGHDAGEVASSMAVSLLCSEAQSRILDTVQYSLEELEQIFNTAFQNANNGIKDFSERNGSDMGTTMVAAMVVGHKSALIANVGDSRAYLHRSGKLYQVSKDHSFVQKMVDQKQLTPEEARHHPHSNILLRTVGTERNIKIDIFRVQLESKDTILLCSDGLWGEVEDYEMEQIITSAGSLRASSRELLQASHLGGGKDNVTHMLIQIP